jgi:predicted ATPase/DNA-binding SARP family transcriptional activator
MDYASGEGAISIHALGHLLVRRGPVLLDLGPAKQRAVFASLVLHAGEVVTVTPLIDALWGDTPPGSARHLVHTYVARLRQVLEPEMPRRGRIHVIGSAPNGYRLLVDRDLIDVSRVQQLREQATHLLGTGERNRAFRLLADALRLWRDPSLRDLEQLLPRSDEVQYARRSWVETVLDYVAIGLDLGETSAIWPLAERLAKAEPLHEQAQALYLLTLDRAGRRAAAIDHYHEVRARLSSELGVDPGPELTTAYKRIVVGEEQPAPSRLPAAARSLPARSPWRGPGPGLGELIQREAELAALTKSLSRHRLVTVAGPPGCGKSALALTAAARLRDAFLGGVVAVDCSDIGDVDQLHSQLRRLLAVAPEAGDVTAIIDGQQILIVLDNVEHLVDPGAALVDEIVRFCRQASVIVTSREPLGLPDETVLRVHPLEVPGADPQRRAGECASVRLFVSRASQVRPDFRLGPDNTDQVAAVCRRLDGLPLAVEMAAACLASDTLDGLVRRLDNPLHEIYPVRRGRPSHHHSLWRTLQRSAECLTEVERWCFVRFSSLPPRFWLLDAQRACRPAPGDPVNVAAVLARLVDKSLLMLGHHPHHPHHPSGPSYRMLSLVHRFAAELAATEPA